MVILKEGKPYLTTDGGTTSKFTEILEWGYRLAETPVGIDESNPRGLWDAKGWKDLVEHMPAHKQPLAAIALENCRAKFGRMNESTRTDHLGTFDKWIFPVLSNMSENDVIDQLVALQPMAGPVSQIVYMDIVTGKAKGQVPAGSPMWRAQQGAVDRYDDSSEVVSNETAGQSASSAFTGTLAWSPLRPGTVRVAIGSATTFDDGNGAFVAATGVTSGTVDYVTGAVTLAFSGVPNGTDVVFTYAYDSEGNSNIQEYEIKLASSPVTARVIKLKALWSEEADQNLEAMFNIKAETTLLNALTNALQYQKHRAVIADLRNRADAGLVTWDATPPSAVSYQTHKYSIIDAFQTASMFIFGATNMVSGNWILTGLQAASVIMTLPQFVAKATGTQMQGVTYVGDLGNFKIFVDPHYPVNEFLVGHKGDQFLTTGYVLAEYQKLYTTPDVMLEDFLHRRGFATSFAKKCVNAKFYARGLVTNAPTAFGTTIG